LHDEAPRRPGRDPLALARPAGHRQIRVSPGMGEALEVSLSGGKVHNLARIRFED
jgi:hypothetical protein